MVDVVRGIADVDGAEPSLMTFVVTDGRAMVALSKGKPLLFSTHKRACPDRDECPFLAASCEAPTEDGFVNHLIISSEQLQGNNTWIELQDGELVGVDWRMVLHRGRLGGAMTRVRNAARVAAVAVDAG